MPAHYICAAFARKEKSYEFCIVSGHRWCIEYPDDSCGGSEWKNRDRRVQSEAAEKGVKTVWRCGDYSDFGLEAYERRRG